MAVAPPPTLAETLAGFTAGFDLDSSPARDALLEKAKLHILDGIGVALASQTMEDHYAEKLVKVPRGFRSDPSCTIIGFRDRAAPPLAAFMNGSLIHGCEYDDRYLEHVVHTESFGLSTALALAEDLRLGGTALATGWIVAAEVAIRLARAPKENFNGSGLHTTSICGTFGAAAAASKLLGLDPNQIADAISLATSFTSGTTEGWNDLTGRNKCVQPGWAAMGGIMAAQMAAAGYECAHTTLDGPKGLFASHAWAKGWSTEPVTEELGSRWRCLDIAFKIFPAGGSRHNVIECTRQLVFEHDIKPEEVERVDVSVASQYADMFEHGRLEKTYRPSSGYNMHGSWPCNVARMILSRYIGVEHLTMEAIREPAFLELVDRVRCRIGDETDYPAAERPTTVRIATSRGVFERSLRKSAGSADDTSWEEIVGKFRRNARLVLPDQNIDRVVDLVTHLDKVQDVKDISELLVP